nr:hypothetical protein CFP56_00639 [Quercus suber]
MAAIITSIFVNHGQFATYLSLDNILFTPMAAEVLTCLQEHTREHGSASKACGTTRAMADSGVVDFVWWAWRKRIGTYREYCGHDRMGGMEGGGAYNLRLKRMRIVNGDVWARRPCPCTAVQRRMGSCCGTRSFDRSYARPALGMHEPRRVVHSVDRTSGTGRNSCFRQVQYSSGSNTYIATRYEWVIRASRSSILDRKPTVVRERVAGTNVPCRVRNNLPRVGALHGAVECIRLVTCMSVEAVSCCPIQVAFHHDPACRLWTLSTMHRI